MPLPPSAACRAATTISPSGNGATSRNVRARHKKWPTPFELSSNPRPTGSATHLMPAAFTINGQRVNAEPGRSLFDLAEKAGVRVPTSCIKNGKCKECVVEVTAGAALLSPPTEREHHLRDSFRLSCQASIVATDGDVRGQTMRRGQMR